MENVGETWREVPVEEEIARKSLMVDGRDRLGKVVWRSGQVLAGQSRRIDDCIAAKESR